MTSQFAIGLVVGFGFGAFLVAGVFYALYLQVSTELFDHISQLKKTVGFLSVKISGLANQENGD